MIKLKFGVAESMRTDALLLFCSQVRSFCTQSMCQQDNNKNYYYFHSPFLVHYVNDLSCISTEDPVFCPILPGYCIHLNELHSDVWELSLQINENGSYLFV